MASYRTVLNDAMDAAAGLWDNKNVLKKFAILKENMKDKGYDGNVLTFLERTFYIIGTLPLKDHEVLDLVTVGYAHFVRKIFMDIISSPTPLDYLQIDFDKLILIYFDKMDSEIGLSGRFNQWRNKNTNYPAQHPVTERKNFFEKGGSWYKYILEHAPYNIRYEGIENKIRQNRTNVDSTTNISPSDPGKALHHLNVRKLLKRCQNVNRKLKRMIYDTFYDYLRRYSVSLRSRYASPERRKDEMYAWISQQPDFAKIIYKFFKDMYFQDFYFSVFKHIYIPKDKI